MLEENVPSVGEMTCLVLGHHSDLIPGSSDIVHPAEVAHECAVGPPPIPSLVGDFRCSYWGLTMEKTFCSRLSVFYFTGVYFKNAVERTPAS